MYFMNQYVLYVCSFTACFCHDGCTSSYFICCFISSVYSVYLVGIFGCRVTVSTLTLTLIQTRTLILLLIPVSNWTDLINSSSVKQGLWALLESGRHDTLLHSTLYLSHVTYLRFIFSSCAGPHSSFSSSIRLKEARTFYSYALQSLPGVVRTGKPQIPITDLLKNSTLQEWRKFNKLVHTNWQSYFIY